MRNVNFKIYFLVFLPLFLCSILQAQAQRENRHRRSFMQTPYFKDFFSTQEQKKLKDLGDNIKEAQALMREAKEYEREAAKERGQAEKAPLRKKNRYLRRAEREQDKAYEAKYEAYEIYSEVNNKRWTIYKTNLNKARLQGEPTYAQEAISYEKKASKAMDKAFELQKRSYSLPPQERIENLQKADSLELVALDEIEYAFAAYAGNSPKERAKEIRKRKIKDQAYNEQRRRDSLELRLLLQENKADINWYQSIQNNRYRIRALKRDINDYQRRMLEERKKKKSAHQARINDLRELIEKSKRSIKRLENEILKKLDQQIEIAIENNTRNYKIFNNNFAAFDRGDDRVKANIVKEEIEKITHEFNRAKSNIDSAYYFNTSVMYDIRVSLLLIRASNIELRALGRQEQIYDEYAQLFTVPKMAYNPEEDEQKEKSKSRSKKSTSRKKRYTGKTSYGGTAIHFKVQLFASEKLPSKSDYRGMGQISSEKLNAKLNAYLSGYFKDYGEARAHLIKAKKNGFSDAQIIAYRGNRRIPLSEARKKATTKTHTIILKDVSDQPKKGSPISYTDQIAVDRSNPNRIVTGTNIKNVPGLVYTVQIAFVNEPARSRELLNLTPIYYYKSPKGTISYSAGIFKTINKANAEKNKVVAAGIKDAFVVAYYNGRRIELKEAIKRQSGSSTGYKTKKLSYAPKTQQAKKAQAQNIVFQVQLAAYMGAAPTDALKKIKQLANTKQMHTKVNQYGLTVYRIGDYYDYQQAVAMRNKCINAGFNDSYIVATKDTKEISVYEALNLCK